MTDQEAKDRINQCEQEIKKSHQDLLHIAELMGNKGKKRGIEAINASENTKNPCITGFIGLALTAIGIIMSVVSVKTKSVAIYGSTPLFIGLIILAYQVFSGSSRFRKVRQSNSDITKRRENRIKTLGESRDKLQDRLRDNRKI